jgi:hypothetical protein
MPVVCPIAQKCQDGRKQRLFKNSWKKFKGTCNSCGIQGHKTVDCRKGQGQKTASANSGTSKGKCYSCGKIGHYSRKCPNKQRQNAGLSVGMAETIDREAWMPKEASPATGQEANDFDQANAEESLAEREDMSVRSSGSAQAEEDQDLLVERNDMDGWTVTIQEAVVSITSSITSENQEKQKQKMNSQKNNACNATNFIGMTISDESLSQSDWSNSKNGYSQDGSATKRWQGNARYQPKMRKPARLKDYGTANGGTVSSHYAEKMSLFEESSDSDLFSKQSEEQEGSVEKHMHQVMMLEGTRSEIKEEDIDTESSVSTARQTTTRTGRCRFCKNSGTAGQVCQTCPKLYSDKPFIYEQSLYDDIITDPPKERIVRRQNIIVNHVSNRGNSRHRKDEPVKLELLQVEPPRGRQEMPEEGVNEVEGEVTLTYLPGYAEGIAELMMPVNNGYYLKTPLEGLQIFRKNSDGGLTEVPYEVDCLSYDVEGRYVGRCQLCKRTGPSGLQCVTCPQTLRTSASKATLRYKTGLMTEIPSYYKQGVHENLEVFVGAQDKSPEHRDVSMVSTFSENLALTDPEERANVPKLGDVILDYNRNESYLRMNMYQ